MADSKTKMRRLKQAVRDAAPAEKPPAGKVADYGSIVELVNSSNKRKTKYTVVRSNDVDAAAGRISAESPVGKELMGARVGETIVVQTPGGERRFKVLSLKA
jgi:transcription elongation factor GreA